MAEQSAGQSIGRQGPAGGRADGATRIVTDQPLGDELEPDFTDQDTTTDARAAVEPDAMADADAAYVPPTDPVIDTDRQGHARVLGGFDTTADADLEVDASAEDQQPCDEALADAVRRELREDAATADLAAEVRVHRRVAYLTGSVPSLDDAENAEAVAARVPGIDEVIEQLTVANL